MDEATRLLYRIRVLPSQLDKARAKYLRLVAEARSLQMADILTDPERLNQAWEREILGAQTESADNGGEWTMGLCAKDGVFDVKILR